MTWATCDVCGFTYVKSSPEERDLHRKKHAQANRILSPPVSRRILRRLEVGKPIYIDFSSPTWLQFELYLRSEMFKREFDYDLPQWSPFGDEPPDACGFLLSDDTGLFGFGAIAGAGAFRWREWSNRPAGWTMDWVWIIPDLRRRGLLSRYSSKFKERFGDFYLQHPLSPAMREFALKHNWGRFEESSR